MKPISKILIFLGIAGVITGLILTVRREYKLLWEYDWWFKNYIIRQINKTRAVIDFYFDVENKSHLDVTIESYDIDMYAEGIFVAKLYSKTKQLIKANGFSIFTLRADFSPQEVLKGDKLSTFLSAFAGLGDIKLEFKGSFNATHAFIKLKKFPFNYTTNLKRFL